MSAYEAQPGTKESQHGQAPLDPLAPLVVGGTAHQPDTLSARLRNPLEGIPYPELVERVRDLATTKGLSEHTDLLVKGALVAQNAACIDTLDTLTPLEREKLIKERDHPWSGQTGWLYLTVFVAALGAAVQGWDQTGSNAANLSFPEEFGIGAQNGQPEYLHDQDLIGLVNSGPYLSGGVLGVWLNDPLNQYFGRRGAIFLAAIILIATPIGSAFTHSWEALLAVRLVMGIGFGCKGSTVPVYAAENAPSRIRGALVMGWQLWVAFGIFLGYCANIIVAKTGRVAWRLQIGSAFIPAVPLALFIYLLPESPRWLMKKGRYQQAFKALLRLRADPVIAARDLVHVHFHLAEEAKVLRGDSFFRRVYELFSVPRNRRASAAAFTVMIAQQMCGINIMAFYSSTVFEISGFTAYEALEASIGFGAMNFVFAIPALFLIDRYGRRSLLLWTFPNMAWTLLVAGFAFFIDDGNTTAPKNSSNARLGIIATFIYIFTAFYSVGEGPVAFAYSAECFPLTHREVGMALAVATNFIFAFVLTITFPRILASLSPAGAFGLYCGFNILAYIMIFHLCPETKRLSLEELDQVFSISYKQTWRYNYTKAVPHFYRRWILWRRDDILEPLYDVDQFAVGDMEKAGDLKSTAGFGISANGHNGTMNGHSEKKQDFTSPIPHHQTGQVDVDGLASPHHPDDLPPPVDPAGVTQTL